LYLITVVSHWW